MPKFNDLISRLEKDANIQDSEDFDNRPREWVLGAIRRHCFEYASSASPEIPDEHEEAVITLAWEALCYARAAKHVNTPESIARTPDATWGKDVKTSPYHKNLDMAKKLRQRYDDIVASMSTPDSSGGNITQGKLFIRSAITDSVPSTVAQTLEVILRSTEVTAEQAILRWTIPYNDFFSELYLYQSASPIKQDWNDGADDNGVPYISDDASLLVTIQNQETKAAQVELSASSTYYFLLVVRLRTGKFYYSNEVITVTPSA